MKLIKSFIACFSTYSRIPMPHVNLDSDDMKYALMFFPFIGALIGIVEYLIYSLCVNYSIPDFFRACIMSVIPVFITGGIHIDGFMDTVDALSSYGDKEKKLSIMKDPNTGAFSIIYFVSYEICILAFLYIADRACIVPVCFAFVISRIMSSLSVVTIKNAKQNGMLHDIKNNSENRTIHIFMLVLYIMVFAVLIILRYLAFSVLGVVVSALGYYLYKRKCVKEFDGITGDTSGFYLCIMELVLIIVSFIGGKI